MTKKCYIVVEQAYEYNDETYSPVDGYLTHNVFLDKDQAQKTVDKLNLQWIKQNSDTLMEYGYCWDEIFSQDPSDLLGYSIENCDRGDLDIEGLTDDQLMKLMNMLYRTPYDIIESEIET